MDGALASGKKLIRQDTYNKETSVYLLKLET